LRAVRSRLVRLAAVLVAAGVGVFVAPVVPAQAHTRLVTTDPARNAVVPTAPAEVVLTFSEPVRVVADRIKVVDPSGGRADVGEARVEGRTVRIGLRTPGSRGTYRVSYRVLSLDSHPVGGSFSYSVGAPSAAGSAPGGETPGWGGGAVAVVFPLVRALGYAALALLVGAGLVLSLLWPRRLDRRGAIRVLWAGAMAVAVTSVLEVLVQIWSVSGTLADVGWSQARDAMLSQYGAAHSVRIGVALGVPLLLDPLINGEGGRTERVLALLLGVVGLATWPVSGHPVASPVPALSLVADLAHLAAMSVWLGGLAMLAAFLLRRANTTELAGIVPRWSRWAQVAVAILLASGVVQSLIEVGSVSALFGDTYGWLVVGKVGLLAGVLTLAWQSRRVVPRIVAQTGRAAAARLRGLVLAEAGGIAIVLAVAAVLVQTPPARGADLPAAARNEQTILLTSQLYRLSVQIVPGTVGFNELHLYASTPDGQPADVKEWRAKATPSNEVTEPFEVDLLPVGRDRATGQVSIPTAGRWRFTFTLRTTEIDQETVTATFDITAG
jgi:copper transport protein